MPITNAKDHIKRTTVWENPAGNPHHVRFSIYLGPPAPMPARSPHAQRMHIEHQGEVDVENASGRAPAETIDVDLAPGESIELLSEHDRAIQQLDEHGQIVGGLAPMLRCVNGPPRKLHESIANAMKMSEKPPPEGVDLDDVFSAMGRGADDEPPEPVSVAAKMRRVK
jgi:hypothetical protein